MNNLIKKLFFLFFLFITFFLKSDVYAQDSRNDYQVEYFVNNNSGQIQTKVNFNIKITNLRSDLYVKQFSLSFPGSFVIHDINASDDHVSLTPKITAKGNFNIITLQFSNPNVGKGSINNFYLNFYQDNLFEENGNVWEVIIPTIENRADGDYKITVNLPPDSRKKISIAKPKPDFNLNLTSGNQIIWNNPKTKTVYAIFGNEQYFKANLIYHLKNDQIVPVYSDIAFPPDTLYQKIIIDKINPMPNYFFQDEDGNILGRYILSPREKKDITYSSNIVTYIQPRDELLPSLTNLIGNEKKYLLSESKYWRLTENEKLKQIPADIKNIYDFVVGYLSYDSNKVKNKNIRLGSNNALSNPSKAVCMEFTDLFIALAREKGIYAREIEGFGFSHDPELRPLSLVSDILHTWPEYFDSKSNFWKPVDPTWGKTSGIDYFSSLDLNHIAFVIHGKNSDYPFPAGSYKYEDSKDVSIVAEKKLPKEINGLSYSNISFTDKINDKNIYYFKFKLKNSGNTYIWNKEVKISAENFDVFPSSIKLDSFAPYEERSIVFSYKAAKQYKSSINDLSIILPDGKKISQKIYIVTYGYDLGMKLSLFLLVIVTLILFILRKKNVGH